MPAQWTCPVCASTVASLTSRSLRGRRARHEVACGSSACLAWHEQMRATHRASSLIDPDSEASSVAFMVDLRTKLHA